MKEILISDVVCATNGKVDNESTNSDDYISNITTSSSEVTKGSLFIAIRNGHNYVQEAIDNGAICCLLEREVDIKAEGITYIYVSDTVQAMIEFATFYRSLFNIPAIAITGSNGKTSTKDIVASVLSNKYNVLKTEGNYNNEIGVPLTIFKLRSEHEMLVVEMGMNHAGEIERLVNIVKPEVAIITNIGVAHIEHLGSKKGILKAKMEITKSLNKNGVLILNNDDEMLATITKLKFKNKNINILTYGKDINVDYNISNVISTGMDNCSFDVINNHENNHSNYELNYAGDFMVYNALCGIVCGEYFDVPFDGVHNGLLEFSLSKNRLEKSTLKCGAVVINDSYNASPDSMKASISILDNENRKKTLILGDMFELGENSQIMHKDLGKYLRNKNFYRIIFCGEMMKYAYSSYSKINENNSYYVKTIDEIVTILKDFSLNKDDIVFLKASNGMKFKNVVEEIKEKF